MHHLFDNFGLAYVQLIDWLIDCYVFKVQAAMFQPYPGHELEMDAIMNMKWWWNEKWEGTQG